ncbi:FAD-binding and (Fe-S)-binding domain-containing protein [Pelistega suis]|uniref:FAD-binding and (Fe-S)-binding domain-containing protein n=1 Tax=Pelistega suis TaxID=1631957 RepID=UPI00211C0FA5|nr:FAD-binding and (Fe-S)-binding domain-containing protein [Pelistega suis]MCQ9327944.1 FAD-binding oxidoreductase [Pelistega suis]
MSTISPLVQRFLSELRPNFKGDIASDESSRLVFSTDNSIYQRIPQAIVFPKDISDLQALAKLAQQDSFKKVVLTARGGGTGTNGQSLTDGVIVDMSRHMNHIIAIDPEKRTATVQAGVVKDQLNAALKEHGLFFAPELSTSNRATIGGMINTDASGQGSCRYGKTRHHVLGLKTVLLGGDVLETVSLDKNNWQDAISTKSEQQKSLYQELFELANNNTALIQQSFPELNRSLTGYDLPNLLTETQFDMNSILCGSEGTLGFIAEATLNVLPIPKHQLLINIGYTDFQAALRDAKALMARNPLSIETVDAKVLGLAKQDIVWNNVAQYFPEAAEPIAGINLVEITSDDETELEQLKQAFLSHLETDTSVKRLSITTAVGRTAVNHIYAMRKRAVGLLGNVQGEKRPQPFVEDTAVPPENLADYIAEFRALLDGMGLDYGMFGHVDAGVLHVRPLIDMKEPQAKQIIQDISDKVAELTHKYGGVLWGEHGKGLRSAYAPIFFGEAYPLVQKVKTLFDPHNQLNPGKIATPTSNKEYVLTPLTEVAFRGDRDRQVNQADWLAFGNAMHCNGNGACFNYDLNDPMCPSYKVTRDRVHSPKGRATLLKEWLRRETIGEQSNSFDKEVYEALHGCLSCKSCAGQCPVKVDIPDAKARFLERYHQRNKRQLRDYALASLEQVLPYLLPVKGLYNALQNIGFVRSLQERTVQLVDLPSFHTEAHIEWDKYGATLLNKDLSNYTPSDNAVAIVQDAFTRFFDSQVLIDLLQLLNRLGAKVYVLPYFANGKPLHVHGFLKRFDKVRRNNIALLAKAESLGMSLIGLDPAMTLVYRQEYTKAYLDDKAPALKVNVQLLQEWLLKWLANNPAPTVTTDKVYQLAAHCTERTQVASTNKQWQDIFKAFGIKLETPNLGCCGMAGTYGHEQEHKELSRGIYEQSWQAVVRKNADSLVATGFSCRCQVARMENQDIKHPLQVLLAAMNG